MRSATVADFESTIKNLGMDDFRTFMNRMLEMRIQRSNYDSHFGSATDHFVEACRNIACAADAGRLGTLIKRLFDEASFGFELTSDAAPMLSEKS